VAALILALVSPAVLGSPAAARSYSVVAAAAIAAGRGRARRELLISIDLGRGREGRVHEGWLD
jgi:hypothetical protein